MGLLPPLATSSAKFENFGDTVSGELVEIGDPFHETEYEKTTPAYWDDEKTRPKQGIRFLLKCTPTPGDPDDDGMRGVYATISPKQGGLYWAINTALKDATALGGILTITFTGHDPASKNPKNPRKLYTAVYQAPGLMAGAPAADPAYQQPPVQQAPQYQQPPAQPQYQQPAAPAPQPPVQQAPPPAAPPAAAPAGPPAGITAEAWAAMPPETQQAILASRAPY